MNNNDANTTIDGKKIEVTIGSLLYSDKVLINLEDGYEIKDENGQLYAVKKKEYPKSYEECEKILGLEDSIIEGCLGYEYKLLNAFQKLLICRDTYWKIAGDEMGLGKPWYPDWDTNENELFVIANYNGTIVKTGWYYVYTKIIVFPTAELRDIFYENFKDLIEICKTLL